MLTQDVDHRPAACAGQLLEIVADIGEVPVADRAAQAHEAPRALEAEVARLHAALDEERTANAQLQERVRALRERAEARVAELEASLLEARGAVAALEAERDARTAEVDAVLAELIPIVEEAR